jgi:protein-S-isoprenylcysteine O-methyltransferase Ste14
VIGRFLFRWRGVTGALGFVVLLVFGRPTGEALLGCLPLLLAGLAVRFWATGYIGLTGRVDVPGGTARICSGPYRLLRHPLYIGNALLVAAALVAYRPPLWLGATFYGLFLLEYGLIVVAEEAALRGLPADRSARFSLRRAMEETRTWLVVAVLYLLSWLYFFIVVGTHVN